MKIQGMEERTVGRGSNNHNHTQGYSGAQKLTSGVDLSKSLKHKCVSEQSRQPV